MDKLNVKNIKKFLFRCVNCELIMAVDIEKKEDLKKVEDNKMFLECPCGSTCKILRD